MSLIECSANVIYILGFILTFFPSILIFLSIIVPSHISNLRRLSLFEFYKRFTQGILKKNPPTTALQIGTPGTADSVVEKVKRMTLCKEQENSAN